MAEYNLTERVRDTLRAVTAAADDVGMEHFRYDAHPLVQQVVFAEPSGRIIRAVAAPLYAMRQLNVAGLLMLSGEGTWGPTDGSLWQSAWVAVASGFVLPATAAGVVNVGQQFNGTVAGGAFEANGGGSTMAELEVNDGARGLLAEMVRRTALAKCDEFSVRYASDVTLLDVYATQDGVQPVDRLEVPFGCNWLEELAAEKLILPERDERDRVCGGSILPAGRHAVANGFVRRDPAPSSATYIGQQNSGTFHNSTLTAAAGPGSRAAANVGVIDGAELVARFAAQTAELVAELRALAPAAGAEADAVARAADRVGKAAAGADAEGTADAAGTLATRVMTVVTRAGPAADAAEKVGNLFGHLGHLLHVAWATVFSQPPQP